MNKLAKFLNAHISGLVTDKPEILAAYSRDMSVLEMMPRFLCIPKTAEDIQFILRFSAKLAKKGYNLPIGVRGAGLDTTGADLTDGLLISMEKFNTIEEIDTRESLVRVKAGITLGELNDALALFGLELPVVASRKQTIGSLISTALIDEAAKKYGSIYYFTDRIEVVLPNGEIFQSTSLTKRGIKLAQSKIDDENAKTNIMVYDLTEKNQAVIAKIRESVHNRSGYRMVTEVNCENKPFDVLPIFFGAQGTLGVITEVILKVQPIQYHTRQYVFEFTSINQALAFSEKAKELEPRTMNLYDGRIFKTLESLGRKAKLLESNTATAQSAAKFYIYLDFAENFFRIKKIDREIEKLRPLADKSYVDQEKYKADFNNFNFGLKLYLNSHDVAEKLAIVDKTSIPAEKLPDFLRNLQSLEQKFHQNLPVFGSLLTDLYSIRPEFDLTDILNRKNLIFFLQSYAKTVYEVGGSLSGGFAEGRTLSVITSARTDQEIKQFYHQIRQTFDPDGIMSPGVKQGATLTTFVRHLREAPLIGFIEY